MSGLKKWLDDKWVDIGAPKKNGKYQPCGRQKGSKRAYPKCVPLAKATRMTKGEKASAVKRKRAAEYETNQIVAPVIADIIHFLLKFTVFKYSITGYISTNIKVCTEFGDVDITRI